MTKDCAWRLRGASAPERGLVRRRADAPGGKMNGRTGRVDNERKNDSGTTNFKKELVKWL